MWDFFARLFSDDFMPHGHCFMWRPEVLWLHVGSDAVIALAYFSIPAALLSLLLKKRNLEYHWVFFLFAAFIFACGMTHAMGIWTMWNATYRLEGVIKFGTGLVSIATAIALWPLIPKVVALPTPAQLRVVNEQLQREIVERQQAEAALLVARDTLEQRVQERTAALEKANLQLQNEMARRQQTEERFHLAVEAAPNAMVMVDIGGKINLVNARTEEMFGYRREELLGRSVEKLVPKRFRSQHPDHRAHFFSQPQARPMGGDRSLFALHKDGHEFPVEIGLNPIQTANGILVLSAIIDISERKQAEEALQRANRTLQLKNVEMEQFVYTVSHDLKSPLVTCKGYVGMLREDLQAGALDEVEDSLDRINRATEHMGQLIEDLLQFSRIGRVKNTVERIDMDQLVAEVVDRFRPQLEERPIRISVEPDLPPMQADREAVFRVFDNLISNAFKYGQGTADTKIQIGSTTVGDEIRFFVKDNGPGIAAEYQKQIFGLFQRLDTTREGTGIGLAVVAKTMQVHQGRAWVESAPGQGATFWLAFPQL